VTAKLVRELLAYDPETGVFAIDAALAAKEQK